MCTREGTDPKVRGHYVPKALLNETLLLFWGKVLNVHDTVLEVIKQQQAKDGLQI